MKILKAQTCEALSYCFDLLSFIFQDKDAGSNINAIYLFGSAIRGILHQKSDIDLFIDCTKKDEMKVQKLVNVGISKFLASKDYAKWKLLHFMYPFSIQVGQLEEWELKLSVASEGLLLYSKKTIISMGERKVLFVIELPKEKAKYVRLRRELFGRDEEVYKKSGVVYAMNGEKISSNVFLVPREEQIKMMGVLANEKVNFTMKEISHLES